MKLFLSLALFAAFCFARLPARMVSARDFPLLLRRLYRLCFRFSLSVDCLSAVIPRGCRRCWRSRSGDYTACRPSCACSGARTHRRVSGRRRDTCALLSESVLSREAAERVNRFCNCASPGFCIGLVGLGVFGSARAGAMLYGMHIVSALLVGLFFARTPLSAVSQRIPNRNRTSFPSIFCASVQQQHPRR